MSSNAAKNSLRRLKWQATTANVKRNKVRIARCISKRSLSFDRYLLMNRRKGKKSHKILRKASSETRQNVVAIEMYCCMNPLLGCTSSKICILPLKFPLKTLQRWLKSKVSNHQFAQCTNIPHNVMIENIKNHYICVLKIQKSTV